MSEPCYGQTIRGSRCQLPNGHYPKTKHRVDFPNDGFQSRLLSFEWTDEAMKTFKRMDRYHDCEGPPVDDDDFECPDCLSLRYIR